MSDHVVDTNVLLVASSAHVPSPFADSNHVPATEQLKVLTWLDEFRSDSTRKLVLDREWTIWSEYEKKLTDQDLGLIVARDKLAKSLTRDHTIELDSNKDAVLPTSLTAVVVDTDDRKFVAVALADDGRSSIVNACDPGWYDAEEALADEGISVLQLIDTWCRTHWEGEARS